jgi:hypothetical protein
VFTPWLGVRIVSGFLDLPWKKILTWLGISFIIFFIAFFPEDAADVFKSIGSGILDIWYGFRDFFVNLVS